MLKRLWKCGRVLRTSLSPAGRVDKADGQAVEKLTLYHSLTTAFPTLSGFSPTVPQPQNYNSFLSFLRGAGQIACY